MKKKATFFTSLLVGKKDIIKRSSYYDHKKNIEEISEDNKKNVYCFAISTVP